MKEPILAYTAKARNSTMLTEKSIVINSLESCKTQIRRGAYGVDVGCAAMPKTKLVLFVKIISNCSDPDVPPNKNPGYKGQYGSSLNITAELNSFMKNKSST